MELTKFSQELIELQREITNGLHPTLTSLLGQNSHLDFEHRLGLIAAHCGVPIDGVFSEDGLRAIYKRLTDILIDRRESAHGIIVVRDDPSQYVH